MIRVGKELDMNVVCFEFMNIINELITIIIKDFLQKRMNFSFIDDPEVTRIDDQHHRSNLDKSIELQLNNQIEM